MSVSIRNLGTVIIVYSYLLSCVKNYIIWNRLAGVIYHEREKEKKGRRENNPLFGVVKLATAAENPV